MESEERIDTGKNRSCREENVIRFQKIPEFQKKKKKIMKIPLNRENRIRNSLGIVIKKIHRAKLNKKKKRKRNVCK